MGVARKPPLDPFQGGRVPPPALGVCISFKIKNNFFFFGPKTNCGILRILIPLNYELIENHNRRMTLQTIER